ncbi:MAG: type II toxin-antitoxin system VapC family toxin [Flavobacteriales bacterium]|nr:type II toxin-antitoxin system VapC family toxin [Flavobacteriales bacterium]MBL0127963.1 type II toxin-antitoxin system VapC family toxin [Flavobacteriales bacterium]MCC6936662.1 type II toxin-antitoxin system VapC family toxin [Flavobacteriales bacterium]
MKVLLDTHVFLWFILGQRQCTTASRSIIEDPKNECLVSIATLWEIAIKHMLGKLELHRPIEDFFKTFTAGGFVPLPITMSHILELSALPMHHRDPFDRMLIAQAKAEGMLLLTADPCFALYDVPLVKP